MAQVSTTSKQSVAQSVPTKDRFGMRRARSKQLWATTQERATHVHNYNYMALRHNHLIHLSRAQRRKSTAEPSCNQLQLHGFLTQPSNPTQRQESTAQPSCTCAQRHKSTALPSCSPTQHLPKGELANQVNKSLRNSSQQRARTMQTLRLQRKPTWCQ